MSKETTTSKNRERLSASIKKKGGGNSRPANKKITRHHRTIQTRNKKKEKENRKWPKGNGYRSPVSLALFDRKGHDYTNRKHPHCGDVLRAFE